MIMISRKILVCKLLLTLLIAVAVNSDNLDFSAQKLELFNLKIDASLLKSVY